MLTQFESNGRKDLNMHKRRSSSFAMADIDPRTGLTSRGLTKRAQLRRADFAVTHWL